MGYPCGQAQLHAGKQYETASRRTMCRSDIVKERPFEKALVIIVLHGRNEHTETLVVSQQRVLYDEQQTRIAVSLTSPRIFYDGAIRFRQYANRGKWTPNACFTFDHFPPVATTRKVCSLGSIACLFDTSDVQVRGEAKVKASA